MAAYIRNQVLSTLNSVASPSFRLGSFIKDALSFSSLRLLKVMRLAKDAEIGNGASNARHLEPKLDLLQNKSIPNATAVNSRSPQSAPAMTNRDGRREPVLNAGESAQRRLF